MKKRDPTTASVPTASSHRSSIEPRGPPEFNKEHARQLSLAKRGRNNSLQSTPRPAGADLSPIPSAGDGTSPMPDAPKAAASRIKEFVSSHVTPLRRHLSPHPSAQDVTTPQDQNTASNGSSQTLNVPIPHHFTYFKPTDPLTADAAENDPGVARSGAAAAAATTTTTVSKTTSSSFEEIASGVSVKGILLILSVVLVSSFLCSLAVSDNADYIPDYFSLSYRRVPFNGTRHGLDRFIPQFERQTALRVRAGTLALASTVDSMFPSVGLVIDDACMGVRFVLQSIVDYVLCPIWNFVFRPNYFSRAATACYYGIDWLYHLPFQMYHSFVSFLSRTSSPLDPSAAPSHSLTHTLIVYLRRASHSVGKVAGKLASTLPFLDNGASYRGTGGSAKAVHLKTHHEYKVAGEHWPAIVAQSPDFIYSEARGELLIALEVSNKALSNLKLMPDGLHMTFDVDHILATNKEWNASTLKAEKVRLQKQTQQKLSHYTFPAMRLLYERRRARLEAHPPHPTSAPKETTRVAPAAAAVDCNKKVDMARQEEHAACDKARSALTSTLEKQKKSLRAEIEGKCEKKYSELASADKADCEKRINTTKKELQAACDKKREDLLLAVDADKKKLRAEVEVQREARTAKETEVAAAICAKKINATRAEERAVCATANDNQKNLRAEIEAQFQEKVDDVQNECTREKESLTQALEERERELAEQQAARTAACAAATTASEEEVTAALDKCRNESKRLATESKKNITTTMQNCKAQLSKHTAREKELEEQIETITAQLEASETTLKAEAEAQRTQWQSELQQRTEAEVHKASEALRKCREKLENKTNSIKEMIQTHKKDIVNIRKAEAAICEAAVAEAVTLGINKTEAVRKDLEATKAQCAAQVAEAQRQVEENTKAMQDEIEEKTVQLQELEVRLSESSMDQKQWMEQQRKHAQEMESLRKTRKESEEQWQTQLRACEDMRVRATQEAESKARAALAALNASHVKQNAAAKEMYQAECAKQLELHERHADDNRKTSRQHEHESLLKQCDEKVKALKKSTSDELNTCVGKLSSYKQQMDESSAQHKKGLEETVQVLVQLSQHNCASLSTMERKQCEQRVNKWAQSLHATPLTIHTIASALDGTHGALAPVLSMVHADPTPAPWAKRLMVISSIGFLVSLVALYYLLKQVLALRRKNILLKSTALKTPPASPHASNRRHSKGSSYYTSDLYLVERTALDSFECLTSWHLACCNLLLEHELHSMRGVHSTIKGPGEPITTVVTAEADVPSPDDIFSQHTQTFSEPDLLNRAEWLQLSAAGNKGVEAYFNMLESYYVDLLEAITNRELVEEQLSEMEDVASEQQALLQKQTTAVEDLKKASALRETEMRMAQRKHQVEVGRLTEDLDRRTEEFAEERSLLQEQMAHLREEAQQAKHMRDLQSEMVAVLEEQLTRLSRTLSDVQGSQRPWRSSVGGSPAREEHSGAAVDMSGFEQRLHELIRKDRDPPRDLESELDIFRSRGESERPTGGSTYADPASSPSQGYTPRTRQTMMRSGDKLRTPESTKK